MSGRRVADGQTRAPGWSISARDLGAAVLSVIGATIGLLIGGAVVPAPVPSDLPALLAAGLLVSVCGVLLRALLVPVAARLGWPGAVLLGLGGQALAVWLVLYAPWSDASFDGATAVWSSIVVAWIVAAVSTLLVWLATAGADDAVTASLLRRARRRRTRVDDPDTPGVVFVQADGVPFPVLDWCVRAGTLPTLSRWVRTGTHRMVEWRPALPATTPASQMGILHGTIEGIPAFRWVDRSDGRVYVANKPRDAVLIERKHSDGLGLLADDGVSVGNLFSGDAPTSLTTMSTVDRSRQDRAARTAIAEFLGRPTGFARGLNRTLSEIARERFQAARSRRRDVRPRVHRGWSFALERAALLGVVRDLNTTLVADAMLRGSRVVYVDYVDYDAVAHHAGVLQPESLSALEGIDAVLGQIERVAAVAPRPYHVVVLSDHGQSQGEIFADRYGEDLATLVARLADSSVVGAVDNDEGSGSLNSVVASSGDQRTLVGRALDRLSARLTSRSDTSADAAAGAERTAHEEGAAHQFVVFGSGNLGLVYLAHETARATREELDARFPGLVPGLVAHPGVGFVVVRSATDGVVVLGRDGEHRISDGRIRGCDPLAPYGGEAAAFVARAAAMPEAPDIYVNSLLDDLGEVAAFEGLVGCHGGLGGWQDRAMLVHPVALAAPEDMVVGADAMHRLLVGWLEQLGHRRHLNRTVTGAGP